MSLHIEPTDEAILALKKERKKAYILSGLTSLLGLGAIVAVLYFCKIISFGPEQPTVTCVSVNDEITNDDDTPTPEVATETQSAAPNAAVKVMVAATSADVTMPPVDLAMDVPTDSLSTSLDIGLGNGVKGEDTTSGGFGVTNPSGSALEGTLYDTKQTRGGSPTNLSEAQFTELLSKFVNGGWKESDFNKFFKADVKLYAAQFYIPRSSAAEAPKAFKCEKQVQPSRWIAVYRGKVKAPKSGKFRFVGAGDDSLVVRFNNENVFDYGWFQATLGKMTTGENWKNAMLNKQGFDMEKKVLQKAGINVPPVTFYKYESSPHWNNALGGVAAGKTFTVKEGQTYPIEILVSEIPGGEFGMTLLIEEVGAKPFSVDKKTGSPILPLFRTNHGVPMTEGKEKVPFDEIGLVWETVK